MFLNKTTKSQTRFDKLTNFTPGFSTLKHTLNLFINGPRHLTQGVIYLISCKKCRKQYVGSTITSFRYRFNNHKSSLTRFGRGQRGICGEHLYSHFFSKGHSGLTDVSVPIIDKTDIGDPTTREGFWTHKLKCFTPLGLNIMDI